MKEVQLQSFYSVSQCAGWCLHKSLWLNYSGESTHILYDNPWRIVQPQIPQPAANLLRGSDCGQVGPDDWERQWDESFQLYASCDYSPSLLVDIELTYLPYILYHLTGTGGTSLCQHSVFFLLSCQNIKTHNAYHLVTVLYVFMKHECCNCNCRGSPDKIITKQWLFKTFCHCLFEVVLAQAVIPTTNCPSFSWNTVRGLKWIYCNYYSHMFHRGWKFPHVRRVSVADCRCCCAGEHWTWAPWEKPYSKHTNSKVRTLHNTEMLVIQEFYSSRRCTGVILDERCEKWGSRNFPRISRQRNSEVVQVTLECEMWVLGRHGPDRHRGPSDKEGNLNLSITSLLCQ